MNASWATIFFFYLFLQDFESGVSRTNLKSMWGGGWFAPFFIPLPWPKFKTHVLHGPAGVDARFDLAVLVHAEKRFHGIADQLLLVRHVTKVIAADRLGNHTNIN